MFLHLPRNSPTTGTDTSTIRRSLFHSGKRGSMRPVTGFTPRSPWKLGRGSAKRSARFMVPQRYDNEELRRFHSSMNTVDQIMLNIA